MKIEVTFNNNFDYTPVRRIEDECISFFSDYGFKPTVYFNRYDFATDLQLRITIYSNELLTDSAEIIMNLKKRILDLFNHKKTILKREDFLVKVNKESHRMSTDNEEFDYEKKSQQYISSEPKFNFERLILSDICKNNIIDALNIFKFKNTVFGDWGLYEIQPHPVSALNFFGPSGTGKSMAAECVAQYLGKKILKVSYADVESMYHGVGPKMVKAIFLAAKRDDSVLFFDEADSLLSKRLTIVTQGSEQAINSLRSQLLISLEEFEGIVIFSTNLISNYDPAFLTRIINIKFDIPDQQTRKEIWRTHIYPMKDGERHSLNIPLEKDIDLDVLSEKYNFVGREIRNAVIYACVNAASNAKKKVCQADFLYACNKIENEKNKLNDKT